MHIKIQNTYTYMHTISLCNDGYIYTYDYRINNGNTKVEQYNSLLWTAGTL